MDTSKRAKVMGDQQPRVDENAKLSGGMINI